MQDLVDNTKWGGAYGFYLIAGGTLKNNSGRTIIPNDDELRRQILDETHQTRYTVQPHNNKMYQDLKMKFRRCGMKHNVAKNVAQCPSCQLVKDEHQRPAAQL